MKNHATEHPRGWRRRAQGALGALVIAGSVVAVTASAASARQACDQPQGGGANTCLTIAPTSSVPCPILVGVDVDMSRDDAQRVINSGDIGALIMANDHDDPYRDTASLFEVRRRSVVAGDHGLSAEFYMEVGYEALNEDRDGGDEVYARVILYDPRYDQPRIFHSGIIKDNYGGCLTCVGPGCGGGPIEP
jgi:hypothetical protein